jgi:DNA polymerase III sliding clamp (beta) subunit (PCNA family)
MYNKNNLRVAKCARESDLKPELASVLFTGLHTVATDGFRLMEISVPHGEAHEPVLLNAKNVGALKATDKDMIVVTEDGTIKTPRSQYIGEKRNADDFPKYQHLFPTETPVVKMTVNAAYLSEMLAIMARLNKFEGYPRKAGQLGVGHVR